MTGVQRLFYYDIKSRRLIHSIFKNVWQKTNKEDPQASKKANDKLEKNICNSHPKKFLQINNIKTQ